MRGSGPDRLCSAVVSAQVRLHSWPQSPPHPIPPLVFPLPFFYQNQIFKWHLFLFPCFPLSRNIASLRQLSQVPRTCTFKPCPTASTRHFRSPPMASTGNVFPTPSAPTLTWDTQACSLCSVDISFLSFYLTVIWSSNVLFSSNSEDMGHMWFSLCL